MFSELLGSPVWLSRDVPPGLRLHRLWPEADGMVPEWEREGRAGELAVTAIAGSARGTFRDFGAVHVITAGALQQLARRLGERLEPVRFRANLLLDLPQDPAPGTLLRIGDVALRVSIPTPRCVVPALPHSGMIEAPRLLTELARSYRQPVAGLGRAACFGFYAEVEAQGVIATGTPVIAEG